MRIRMRKLSGDCTIFDAINDCNKHLLIERYDDLDFLDLFIKECLRCVRCNKVAIIHYLSNCHHMYCNKCKIALNISLDRKCTKCNAFIVHMDSQKVSFEIQICALKVRCPNQKNGCICVATLAEIASHFHTCVYSPDVRNIWKSKTCTESQVYNILDEQLFLLETMFLMNKQNTMAYIRDRMSVIKKQLQDKSATKSEAVKKIIKKLEKEIKDHSDTIEKEIKDHSDTSPEKLDSGTIKKRTKTVKLRYNDEIRQKLALFNENFEDLKQPRHCIFTPTCTAYSWVINDVDKRNLKIGKVTLFSPEFKINGHPLKAQVGCMFPNAIMWLTLINENNPRVAVQLDMYPQVTYIIRNGNAKQGSVFNHLEHVIEYRFLEQLKPRTDKVFQYACQFGKDNFQGAFQNDSITIDIIIDFPHLIDEPFSTDGSLVWKIENFSKNLRDYGTGCQPRRFSPYFYTGTPGYRMKAELHTSTHYSEKLSKRNNKRRLPISLIVLAGEYDKDLDKKPTFTVELFLFTPRKILVDKIFTNDDLTLMHLLSVDEMTYFSVDDSFTIEIIVRLSGAQTKFLK